MRQREAFSSVFARAPCDEDNSDNHNNSYDSDDQDDRSLHQEGERIIVI